MITLTEKRYRKEIKRGLKGKVTLIDCKCGACFPQIYWKYCPKCKKPVKEILLEEEDKMMIKIIEAELEGTDGQ